MKTALLILSFVSAVSSAPAQGTVVFINTSGTLVSTNAIALGGTAGITAPGANQFYYGLFTASSTINVLSPSAQELLGATWTFTGLYATNIGTAGGRLSGGADVATLTGWPPGETNSFVILGWSASLGHDWSIVAAELEGAVFSGGFWSGQSMINNGFLGASPVGFGMAAGGNLSVAPFSLFDPIPNAQGDPLTSGFTLYAVNTPEPGTWNLWLAALGLFVLRRFWWYRWLFCSFRKFL